MRTQALRIETPHHIIAGNERQYFVEYTGAEAHAIIMMNTQTQ